MSNNEGYPGTGGFYDPADVSASDEPTPTTDHLRLARERITEYQERIERDLNVSGEFGLALKRLHEDRSHQRAMQHIGYAQADALTRLADTADALLEEIQALRSELRWSKR